MIGGLELVTVSGDARQHFPGGAFALAESGGGERERVITPEKRCHGCECSHGIFFPA